jgi:hypothetical protein
MKFSFPCPGSVPFRYQNLHIIAVRNSSKTSFDSAYRLEIQTQPFLFLTLLTVHPTGKVYHIGQKNNFLSLKNCKKQTRTLLII